MESFSIEKKDNYTVVKSHVEKLDSRVSPELKSNLVQVNSQGERNIIIDLTDSRYCDSSGLSALLVANRLCRDAQGTMVLTGLQDSVKKLVSISQLDNVLNIVPSLDEAVQLITQDETERETGEDDQPA